MTPPLACLVETSPARNVELEPVDVRAARKLTALVGRLDGETHVATGWSRYLTAEGELRDEYWNVYSVRFDDAGQASAFTEWWIQDRSFARAAREAAVAKALAEAGVNAVP